MSGDVLERRMEQRLLQLCSIALGNDSVDVDSTFAQLGVDSLVRVQFVSAVVREFGPAAPVEAILQASTIREVTGLLLTALAQSQEPAARRSIPAAPSDQKDLEDDVPLIANRYSYFLRRQRNFDDWTLDYVFEVNGRLDRGALDASIARLVEHHGGLRLQAWSEEGRWKQKIVPPSLVSPVVTVTASHRLDEAALRQAVVDARCETLRTFAFPGELFKVVRVATVDQQRTVLLILLHHLVADAYSARLAIGDLFALYESLAAGREAALDPQTTSFAEFSAASAGYWAAHQAEEVSYWKTLRWADVRPLPARCGCDDPGNQEGRTRYVVRSARIGDESTYVRRFGARGRNRYVELVLCAIARAYHRWTGHQVLLLATWFHGREGFDRVDLSRTVGMISETIPLLLPTTAQTPVFLDEVGAQVQRASRRGQSYGALKFIHPTTAGAEPFADHPRPQVSLNVLLPGIGRRRSDRFIEAGAKFGTGPAYRATTQRVFLLSGGVYFRGQRLHFSWDFSEDALEATHIESFADDCLQEFVSLSETEIGGL